MEQILEQSIDNNSQSEHESNPTTITIHAHEEDVEDEQEVSMGSNNDENREIETQVFTDGTPLQYSLKSENGQVTYRVLHVGDINSEQQGASGGQNVAQAIITSNPFGGSNSSSSANTDGPFYVMMAPTQEIISAPGGSGNNVGTIRKAGSASSSESPVRGAGRDDKRRATHNEVERRRRDKINNWIVKLAKIVPDCSLDHTKQGQSKGGILAKACEYIADLVNENAKLNDIVKENDLLSSELDSVRQQSLILKNENRRFRALLQRNGIAIDES